MYSAASTQPTLKVNPQIELASSSSVSENEESLCQEDIQKLLGLQVWGWFIFLGHCTNTDFIVPGQSDQSWQVGHCLESGDCRQQRRPYLNNWCLSLSFKDHFYLAKINPCLNKTCGEFRALFREGDLSCRHCWFWRKNQSNDMSYSA